MDTLPSAARARIQEIDMQISALHLSLKALADQRRSCEALISAYKYPVLTLPTEITSEIFLNFLPAPPERPFADGPLSPSFLCQICRTWRDIALATPALWSAIHLDLDHSPSHPQQLWVLNAWLERSKQCPLSVALEGHPASNTGAFLEALVPHCGRWADMLLVVPFKELRLIQGDMPRLRKVTVGPSDTPLDYSLVTTPITLFDRAPNLTDVVLSRMFNPFVIVLPWAQITTLVGCLYSSEIAEILRHTTRLERFSLSLAHLRFTIMDPIAIPPLLHLTSFSLVPHSFFAGKLAPVLDALTLPALKLLQITEFDEPETYISSLVSFLTRLHRLEELRVTRSRMPRGFYHTNFQESVSKIKVDYMDLRYDW